MLGRRTRRRTLALLGSMVVAAGVVAGTAPAGNALTPVPNSVQQVYSPGAAGVPSTAIPACTAPGTPSGCYGGAPLTLQGTRIGQTAAEPTIGVAPDGTAYMAGSTLVVDTSATWGVAETDAMRSTDGGLTWTSVQPSIPMSGQRIPPANADPMIYVDPTTGRVFTFDLEGACNWLNYSDDKGATWFSNPLACGDVPVDHQTIIAAKPVAPLTTSGYPNVLYWCSNRLIESVCARSLDGGITWLSSGDPAFSMSDTCGGLTGHLGADPEGRIFLPSGNCTNPWVSISSDNGATWTKVQVSTLGSAVSHTSVAVDSAGNVYYVWVNTDDKLPYLAISTDHGLHWSAPQMIAPPGVAQANFPVVAAGDPGHVAISFPSTTSTKSSRAWNQTVAVSTNALDVAPVYLSATGNDPADPIHRGACLGRCGGLWDFIDVQIDAQGYLWVSTSDDCTDACNTSKVSSTHVGDGIAIRSIGGPLLRTPPAPPTG